VQNLRVLQPVVLHLLVLEQNLTAEQIAVIIALVGIPVAQNLKGVLLQLIVLRRHV
jgi:hypothetical protein